mmetsp:Transcript_30499/g.63673  ORF Transcript_30499/g.63673 Transcript_30499/m.63673 type:complete len:220 (-) Transcript_30499:473-1132(-)
MSLSFVSKSVQTAKDDGGFEEKPFESKDGSGDSSSFTGSSLFEQLRSNQEEADAEREEEQRALMRGTVELDEDDKAHLDALDRQRQEKEHEKQKSTQEALAAFRAARADRREAATSATNNHEDEESTSLLTRKRPIPSSAMPKSATTKSTTVAPPIVIRKKKRRATAESNNTNIKAENESTISKIQPEPKESPKDPAAKSAEASLGGLLTGYGSSSDDD